MATSYSSTWQIPDIWPVQCLHWCEPVWCNQHGANLYGALLELNTDLASRDLCPIRGTCAPYGVLVPHAGYLFGLWQRLVQASTSPHRREAGDLAIGDVLAGRSGGEWDARVAPCEARLSLHGRDICVPFPTLRRPIGPLAGHAELRQNLACLPIVCSADRFAWEPDRAKRSACPARCYRDQLWGYPVGNATEIGGPWY